MSTDETTHTHAEAPALLIEAADTIGNRSAERDNADGAAYLALACECVERELDMPF